MVKGVKRGILRYQYYGDWIFWQTFLSKKPFGFYFYPIYVQCILRKNTFSNTGCSALKCFFIKLLKSKSIDILATETTENAASHDTYIIFYLKMENYTRNIESSAYILLAPVKHQFDVKYLTFTANFVSDPLYFLSNKFLLFNAS